MLKIEISIPTWLAWVGVVTYLASTLVTGRLAYWTRRLAEAKEQAGRGSSLYDADA